MRVDEKIKEIKTIWTIGHSIHPAAELLAMLKAFSIESLIDIRSYPSSRRYPHFNKNELLEFLSLHHISYRQIPELGGRRVPLPDSHNTGWRHTSFRGYADYMETESFQKAIEELEKLALTKRIAYMCAEALWWKCHRSLVSDYLKVQGWTVMHIMNNHEAMEHPFTKPARVVAGKLSYSDPQLALHP